MYGQIITSLLETDLYKITMAQAVLHHFPTAIVEYKFKCRNKNVHLGRFAKEIKYQIEQMCDLTFSQEELQYLKGLRFIKPDFVEFLRGFRLNEEFVDVEEIGEDLSISIRGPWFHTIWFEVPILAIVNESYFGGRVPKDDLNYAKENLYNKIEFLKEETDHRFKFSDFGLRRRYSKVWHGEIVRTLKEELPDNFTGTSNVFLAKKYGLKPIGTMAHEWICAGQNLGPRLADSQKFMLQKWADEYRGDLGIALSDTLGVDAFLRDFDMYFAKLFDGVRHDSGDPKKWFDKVFYHYYKLGIDPKTKTVVFSDGLTVQSAVDLWKFVGKNMKVAFGIGTSLTNDVGREPLNIVIKLTQVNGKPVAKISDSEGKCMCEDEGYLGYLKSVFEIGE